MTCRRREGGTGGGGIGGYGRRGNAGFSAAKTQQDFTEALVTSYTISVEAAAGVRWSAVRSQVVTRGKEAPLDHRPRGTQAVECRWIVLWECVTYSQGRPSVH